MFEHSTDSDAHSSHLLTQLFHQLITHCSQLVQTSLISDDEITTDARNRFLFQFGFHLIFEKTRIWFNFRMSLVWFSLTKCFLIQILQLFTTHVIDEKLIYSKYYSVTFTDVTHNNNK